MGLSDLLMELLQFLKHTYKNHLEFSSQWNATEEDCIRDDDTEARDAIRAMMTAGKFDELVTMFGL
jgi:hypothetical protein